MTHLLLFYRIIFYTFGFSLLGFTLYKYLKTRNKSVGAFLFLWSAMTSTAAAYVINYYIYINFGSNNFFLSYSIQGVTVVLTGVSLIYFVHTVFHVKDRLAIRISFILGFLISVILFIPFVLYKSYVGTVIAMTFIILANVYSYIVAFRRVIKLEGHNRRLGLGFMYSFIIFFGLLYVIDINSSVLSNSGHFLFFPLFYIWIGSFCAYIGLTKLNLNESSKTITDFITKYNLTKRESEIALLLAEGLTYREISEKLFISSGTVSTHVMHIYEKTGTSSKIQLNREISRFKN